MNEVFKEYLRKSVLVFFDDILVYSINMEQHIQHLREVFQLLEKHQLVVKTSKCSFGKKEVEYLGHIIGEGKVYTDPQKVEAVRAWPLPVNIK